MTSFLAFILECSAVASVLGTAGAGVTGALLLLSRPLGSGRSAAARANLAFLAGVLPAVVVAATVLAAATPSVAAALGLADDHCATHGHHVHLCLVHAAGLRPTLAAVGALALATFVFRAIRVGKAVVTTSARLAALERLAASSRSGRFPTLLVPGGARLCHATGALRPRILVSQQLAQALRPEELGCALSHEEAHLRRRDPLAGLLLTVAGLFAPPPLARLFLQSYQRAAEEACDAEAAHASGDGALVASSLVKVATLQLRAREPQGASVPAFGEVALAQRVRLLLEPGPRPRGRPLALSLATGVALTSLASALAHAGRIHHSVETLLHHLF